MRGCNVHSQRPVRSRESSRPSRWVAATPMVEATATAAPSDPRRCNGASSPRYTGSSEEEMPTAMPAIVREVMRRVSSGMHGCGLEE